MHRSRLGIFAVSTLIAGLAGCSLPEVLPLVGGNTAGPSPYGPWYEQHWATNSVLLAAADQPGEFVDLTDDEAVDAALSDAVDSLESEDAAVEASAAAGVEVIEFDNSTPYQFPSSAYAPEPAAAVETVPLGDFDSPPPSAPAQQAAPATGGSIRY